MKTFPIRVHQQAAVADPAEPIALTRREMLRGSGVLTGTLALGSPLAMLAPSTSWALELKHFSKTHGTILLQMAKVIFPHTKLPEAVYALLVKQIDTEAAKNPAMAKLVSDGIANLNRLSDGNFIKADAKRRVFVIEATQGQPLFNTIRSKGIVTLYDNSMAFAALGYPGSSWEKGGYIQRGFQDLKWLPEPSEEASPAPDQM